VLMIQTNRIKYWWNEVMYGEKWAEPMFNAIAFYLHVAGIPLFRMG
jgi:hypothetical protein